MLNNAGKEVLIKSVITLIPTYAMHVFRLILTWCSEINAMIARFWWGAKNGDRKIHWKCWEIMTTQKQHGVSTFRNCRYSTLQCWPRWSIE